MHPFTIEAKTTTRDEFGGVTQAWTPVMQVRGYLDLVSGTNERSGQQAAITEGSTHILILPRYREGITDQQRVKDNVTGRTYAITYADNPVGIKHHNEIYLNYDRGREGNG